MIDDAEIADALSRRKVNSTVGEMEDLLKSSLLEKPTPSFAMAASTPKQPGARSPAISEAPLVDSGAAEGAGSGMSNIESIYETVPRLWGDYAFSDRVSIRLERAKHGDSSGVRGAAWLWPPDDAAGP